MLIVISPAKKLQVEMPQGNKHYTQPDFLGEAEILIKQLKKHSVPQLMSLMSVSEAIAELNLKWFRDWGLPFTTQNACPAGFMFRGDVYQGLTIDQFSQRELRFAQQHLRILSGLYGLLRPLDLIQPYRLEMATKLENSRGKDLYSFWGDLLAVKLNETLVKSNATCIVNLASQAYFKALPKKVLTASVVTPVFKELRKGQWRIISFSAKRARGEMAAFIIQNQLTEVAEIKHFQQDGYQFIPELSTDKEWMFGRESQ